MSTDTTTTEFAFVTLDRPYEASGAPNETAVYKRHADTGGWDLMSVEPGEGNGVRETAMLLGAATRFHRNIVHLRKGGVWMDRVPDYLMAESTPRQGIETEIADLRAEAHRISEQAAYSGSWGSGAGLLEARADAMQHVLDALATDND